MEKTSLISVKKTLQFIHYIFSPLLSNAKKMRQEQGLGKETATQFTPLFVWLDVDVSNYMDVCKFYPKFAEERSHSERERERKKKHIISVYVITFYQNCLCV